MRNLILSGGIYHPFAETSASIARHLAGLGLHSEITGVREGFRRLRQGHYDLVTINALAWSMVQAEKYAPYRAEFAFTPDEDDRAALLSHLDRGGGLLGLHTAAICFDGWSEWLNLLGMRWEWGRSHHPMPCYVDVETSHGTFTIWDELYCDLAVAPGTKTLASARAPGIEQSQPVLTAKGRSIYLSLGHDLTATTSPSYALLLADAAKLALG